MILGIEVLSVAGFRASSSSLLYSSPKVGTRDRWIDDADRQAGGAALALAPALAGSRKNGTAEENTNERKTAKAKAAARLPPSG